MTERKVRKGRGGGYAKRAAETLKKLNTVETDWTGCPIQSFYRKLNFTETAYVWMPDFLVPGGYAHAKTDYSFNDNSECELCSHDIFHFYCLKNDNERKYMIVGSTCITHFDVKEWVKTEFNSWAEANLPQEWKNVFLPGLKIIRELFAKNSIWLPMELSIQSEYVRYINSKKKVKQMAKAFEEYGWLLDIIDEVDKNSTRDEIVEAYWKHAPQNSKLYKAMYNKRFLVKKKQVA
mgnify:FL=1